MDDNDDWRSRKARELGLIDTRPVTLAPERADAPGPTRKPGQKPVAPPPYHGPRPPAAGPRAVPTRPVPRALIVIGILVLLALGLAAGWALRGRVEAPLPMPSPAPSDTMAAVAETPPVARDDIVAPPAAAPVAASPVAAPPAKVELPRPTPPRLPALLPPKPRAALVDGRGGALPDPSFSCRGVQTRVNAMICNSAELAALDVAMAQAYRSATASSDGAAAQRIDREQSRFLNARVACGDANCVARATKRRIRALR